MDWVILAGDWADDTGWTKGLPRPLLPLPRGSVIEALLTKYHASSSGTCTVCANGLTHLVSQHLSSASVAGREIAFLEDKLPLGTAGCLKACEPRSTGASILVIGASVWLEDDPTRLLDAHRRAGNALTVFCTTRSGPAKDMGSSPLCPAGVFCVEPDVLRLIPTHGYQDMKEQLIPSAIRAGMRVGCIPLSYPSQEITGWRAYLNALSRAMTGGSSPGPGVDELAPGIWCGRDVTIAPTARLVAPVLLASGCRVDEGAALIGPTMLGPGCHVGAGAWLIRVVAQARSVFDPASRIIDSLIRRAVPRTKKREPGIGVMEQVLDEV